MLTDTNDLYITQGARLFRLLPGRPENLNILTLSYCDDDNVYFLVSIRKPLNREEVIFRCDCMSRRLSNRTRGLIETRASKKSMTRGDDVDMLAPDVLIGDVDTELDFLHRIRLLTQNHVLIALGPSSICSSIVPITDVTSTVTAAPDASTLQITVTAPDCTVTGSPTATITVVSTETDTVSDTTTVTTTATVTAGAGAKRDESQLTSTPARCGAKTRSSSSGHYSIASYPAASHSASSFPTGSVSSSASAFFAYSTTSPTYLTRSSTESTTSSLDSTTSSTVSTTSSTTPTVTLCSITLLPEQLSTYACDAITAACTDLVQPQTVTTSWFRLMAYFSIFQATETISASTITTSTTITNPCSTVTPADATESSTATTTTTLTVSSTVTSTTTATPSPTCSVPMAASSALLETVFRIRAPRTQTALAGTNARFTLVRAASVSTRLA
ncbi:hypothetical protein SCUP515_10736 [Seiridium cupressi]